MDGTALHGIVTMRRNLVKTRDCFRQPGPERKFKLRHKDFAQTDNRLKSCSLTVAYHDEGPTQHFWKHEIPRTARPVGKRVNLTFRVIDPNQ